MRIAAIDPGWDGIGVAVFDLDVWRRKPRELERVLSALIATQQLTTSPKDPPAIRAAAIAEAMRELVLQYKPAIVYVEEPAIRGDYERTGRRNRGSVNKLHMAIGAILAGLAEVPAVIQVRAPSGQYSQKAVRHRRLELMASAIRRPDLLPRGRRGAIQADVWDAIWLGCQALLTRADRDLHDAGTQLAVWEASRGS